jgi:hypothetical protein
MDKEMGMEGAMTVSERNLIDICRFWWYDGYEMIERNS